MLTNKIQCNHDGGEPYRRLNHNWWKITDHMVDPIASMGESSLSSSLTNHSRVGGKVTGNFFLPLFSSLLSWHRVSFGHLDGSCDLGDRRLVTKTNERNKAGACFLSSARRKGRQETSILQVFVLPHLANLPTCAYRTSVNVQVAHKCTRDDKHAVRWITCIVVVTGFTTAVTLPITSRNLFDRATGCIRWNEDEARWKEGLSAPRLFATSR